MPNGYTVYTREWRDDTVELNFDMPIRFHFPEHWEEDLVYTDTLGTTLTTTVLWKKTVYAG